MPSSDENKGKELEKAVPPEPKLPIKKICESFAQNKKNK